MKPITRKEYYLAKAAGTYTGPTPPPVLREDYYLATLAGDYSGNCPAPVTRLEKYMSAAAELTSYVPQPVTRIEKYWYAIAKGTGYVPEPVTREEKFLYAVLKNPPKPEYLDKTAEGSMILLTDSAQAPLTALTVYGHSTQDGTPSPESPVPIASAGNNGEINVTVSDGGTQSQTLTLSTPGGLPGIPVDSGGNYTDESGQQWICDEIDLKRGKYVQYIKKIILDGTEGDWSERKDFAYGFYTGELMTKAICNYFSCAQSINDIGQSESIYAINSTLLVFTYFSAQDLDEWKIWLSQHPVTVYYTLATPIETDLPAEEIAAYQALHTYTPNTSVGNDAEAWMKVGYKATP